jgi:hypothetical protein
VTRAKAFEHQIILYCKALATAKAIGVTVPPMLLTSASELMKWAVAVMSLAAFGPNGSNDEVSNGAEVLVEEIVVLYGRMSRSRAMLMHERSNQIDELGSPDRGDQT